MALRSCLFCGNPATSREHVWPAWILRQLPDRPSRLRLASGREVIYKGDFKIKCVCSKCNTGWMSDLEGNTKFLIEPLLQGVSTRLDTKDQKLVARWAMKTAIVLEGTKPQDVAKFYDVGTRKKFMNEGVLPSNASLWIGKYSGSGLFADGATFTGTISDTGEEGSGSITTMVVGRLVIQVLVISHPSAALYDELLVPMRASHWEWLLHQIHPPNRTCSWPPLFTFHNNGAGYKSLSELTDRWTPDKGRSSKP